MSFFSVNAYAPIIQANNSFHERLQVEGETYAISRARGFETAQFRMQGDLDYLQDWFTNGLVRHIVFVAPDGTVAWEGFVNQLQLTVGGITITHGIQNMANRVIYKYQQIDTTTNPPDQTIEVTTNNQGELVAVPTEITKNDTDSQADYGIKTRILDGGEATATNADVAATVALAQLSEPLRGQSLRTQASKGYELALDLRGYAFMADWYLYEQTASSGTDTATAIIQAMIAADPNSVLSTDSLLMDTNSTATEQFWESDVAWTSIKKVVDRGELDGAIGVPWVGGIYEDRTFVYKRAERLNADGTPHSDNKKQRIYRSLVDPSGTFTDESSRPVEPWAIRPDSLVVTEFVGATMYVDRVNFTPPLGLTLSGDDDVFDLRGLV